MKPQKSKSENWEDKIKMCNHDWVVRLIKFGDAKIPEVGFYAFENPYIYGIVEKAITTAVAEERKRIVEEIEVCFSERPIGDKHFDIRDEILHIINDHD